MNGIELICDESAENLQKIITNIRKTISKEIEIGLQINVFRASKLVDVINNVTFVTHKINPLSDAALTIFYQWQILHEKYNLDLKKIIIKISPAIWQQKAIHTHPGKDDTLEKENPEDDVILNRKFLCLNETIKQNLPKNNTYLNLPIIFSIKGREKIQGKMLENVGDQNLLLAGLSFQEPEKPISKELYYLRFEAKEIIEYKIKIAERFGFGGIAFDSITDDNFEENCGTSLFKDLIKIVK
uniref:HpcH/HpaI aldolase/citrate lyase domain-containing protein n=1 Tax=Panagrolaimus davidi TaxID=227884 RepID=A0A914QU63_9BILA